MVNLEEFCARVVVDDLIQGALKDDARNAAEDLFFDEDGVAPVAWRPWRGCLFWIGGLGWIGRLISGGSSLKNAWDVGY